MRSNKKRGGVAKIFSPEALLKRRIRAHFKKLGFVKAHDGSLIRPGTEKNDVRRLHSSQRAERLRSGETFLARALPRTLPHFADGNEIDPAKVQLGLIRVYSDTREADLFRVATLTWSVPVSPGFGRRLRYLVWDTYHSRLVGVIALGDPVYNLSVRDNLIGWDVHDRSERLVNVLDAYVLGAVPPYNMLLAGKAVACLVRSLDVYKDFKTTYGQAVGVISERKKRPSLLAVTTTSSMGKSSVYNRLRLNGTVFFRPIGYTEGWGHFHIADELFEDLREYLRLIGHAYTDQHTFGEGPNWRLRTIRVALGEIGISESVLRHGIKREVFLCTLAANALEILESGKGRPDIAELLPVSKISDLARERWMVPRSERRDEYRAWRRTDIVDLIRNPPTETEEHGTTLTMRRRGRGDVD